ncbi:MAG TPA: sulfatase-like hydrolase/transferase [Thermoanaerobaculia bacterium]|nr:sulfatase-like hydrolase/transferase [Thermoanaerobaculia bacterium]
MTRLGGFAVLLLAGAAACQRHPAAPGRPAVAAAPSIVLISIDTLRSDHLPIYGYSKVETPGIDALRRDSILFERAYCQVPETFPSHCSALTGLLPAQTGVRDNVGYDLDSAHLPYLPRLLHDKGYATGAAVSAFVMRGETGLAKGFDFYDDGIHTRVGRGLGGIRRAGAETLAKASAWLRTVAGKRPFFLFLHLYEPHAPYQPPEPFNSRYPFAYDGEIAAADQVVGDLLALTRRLGVYDQSLIALMSDHGEGLGEHGEDGHGIFLYRNDLQVPLLLKLPGGERAGASVASPVRLLDLAPTLLGAAGIATERPLAGRSLLEAPATGAPRPVYAESYVPRIHFGWSELTSLIEGNFHFIDGPDPELFDLAADPGETASVLTRERRAYFALSQALRPFKSPLRPPQPVDAETKQKLAALGYIGTAAPGLEGPLPDPKKMIRTLDALQDGLRQFAQRQPAAAVASLRHAVEQNPQMVDGWDYLGRSYQRLRQYDKALAAYKEAMRLSGGLPDLALATATVLVQVGRPDEALLVLHHQSEKSPEDRRLGFLEVRLLLTLGRIEEARQKAEAILAGAPNNADAIYQHGAVAMARRDLPAAERDFRRALAVSPGHPAAMSDLAVLLATEGRLAEARGLLEEFVAQHPEDKAAAANLEQLKRQMGG